MSHYRKKCLKTYVLSSRNSSQNCFYWFATQPHPRHRDELRRHCGRRRLRRRGDFGRKHLLADLDPLRRRHTFILHGTSRQGSLTFRFSNHSSVHSGCKVHIFLQHKLTLQAGWSYLRSLLVTASPFWSDTNWPFIRKDLTSICGPYKRLVLYNMAKPPNLFLAVNLNFSDKHF